MSTKIVCISDTHSQLHKVKIPDGDILIHAGDLTSQGSVSDMVKAFQQLGRIRSRFKAVVVVCGNHDWLGETNPILVKQLGEDNNLIYLDHEARVVEGLRLFGSAYTPEFFSWAFNVPRGEALKKKWDAIPDDTDILVTHGPPYGILDFVEPNRFHPKGEHVGCEQLLLAVDRVQPRAHIFGHIHCASAKVQHGSTIFVNASICDEQYKTSNPARIVIL